MTLDDLERRWSDILLRNTGRLVGKHEGWTVDTWAGQYERWLANDAPNRCVADFQLAWWELVKEAKQFVNARDEGLDAAILWKLSNG